MDQIRTFRTQGYGVGHDFLLPGASNVAWALRHRPSGRGVVVSVFGPSERIKPDLKAIVQAGRTAIKRYATP
jgi:DNA-binding IclR family transcriptional regulator